MSPRTFSEDELVEQPALAILAELGWEVVNAWSEEFGPGGTLGRDSQHSAILTHRLRDAISILNPGLPDTIREEAIVEFTRDRSIVEPAVANRQLHDLLRDGWKTTWQDDRGELQDFTVGFIDFNDSTKNDFLAVNQFRISGEQNRRADTVLFVNGIPLVLAEFKKPARPVQAAYNENIVDYRATVPHLFWPNCFVIASNGYDAKMGATYAPWKFFNGWKVIDLTTDEHGQQVEVHGTYALDSLIRGTCRKDRLLDIVENFVAYVDGSGGLTKIVARNHQVIGVNASIEHFHHTRSTGDHRLGVFWHTQGSGKSLSMLWFTQKILRRSPGKWTFVMVTDRTELDDQLSRGFANAGAVVDIDAVRAGSVRHLRELLQGDHRYVFTLIHKFKGDKVDGIDQMPVLSERDDVIVITDEAHRSQYDTLAMNMRIALPNASFMGFTGTPLIDGEERTKEVFGNYVSTYNFRNAIEDGATVPLFYENRIPELQLVNDDFEEDLTKIFEDAELDDDAEGQLARRFSRQYALITRPERLRTVARDLVTHFVGRGFSGKAMYVGIDKATVVKMYDLVQEAWVVHLAELREQHDTLPELERPWLASRIELMETTDMAVVVSHGADENSVMAAKGLEITPHRKRMNAEAVDEQFKDAEHPLRLVFVCAMWMTGFDAPAVSTIYLDRPMRNHTLMQTIARANRVFADKESGLIVDYIGVFRNLEKALAIYGAANTTVDSPIQDKAELVAALAEAIDGVYDLCARYDVDLDDLHSVSAAHYVPLMNAAVESLLADPAVRDEFLAESTHARKLYKAVLPDPVASSFTGRLAKIRALAERIAGLGSSSVDIGDLADAVDQLLDRSVGAEEYIIRAAADGETAITTEIDLSKLDFDMLAEKFGNRRRAETERLASLLKRRALASAAHNPTRFDLVERIQELIDEYNSGSLNIDEYLRRLVMLSRDLSEEEQRAVREGMSEAELAIFDILTRPDPGLTEEEVVIVRGCARELLVQVHDKLVLDWRKKANASADILTTIKAVLDPSLPVEPYPPELFDQKVTAIFDHIKTQPDLTF